MASTTFFSSETRWTQWLSVTAVDGVTLPHQHEGFFFFLKPSFCKIGFKTTTKATFVLEVWESKADTLRRDQIWWRTSKSASSIEGDIGANGKFVKFKCEAVEAGAGAVREDLVHRFTLSANEPLTLVKGTQTDHILSIELRFKLAKSHKPLITFITDLFYPLPIPQPSSYCHILHWLISKPPNLVLRVVSQSTQQVSHVYIPSKEKLASASKYLKKLVESEDRTEATRSLDGRSSFKVDGNDSDDEEGCYVEDTKKNIVKEARASIERNAENLRRSPGPAPAEKKRKLDAGNETNTASSSNTQQEQASDEIGGNAQALPARTTLRIQQTATPGADTRIITVPDCALPTLQAVIAYMLTGEIVFAPLSFGNPVKRHTFISQYIKDALAEETEFDKPIPVSPRSVYRLAERFGLEELASLALADFEAKLTSRNAAKIALSKDCYYCLKLRKVVHDLVQKDFRTALKLVKAKPSGSHEKVLFADLVATLLASGAIVAAPEPKRSISDIFAAGIRH